MATFKLKLFKLILNSTGQSQSHANALTLQ